MKTFKYQNKRNKNYFEGWYTRILEPDKGINIAVIFAITKNEKHPHAFIQYFDSNTSSNRYFTFDSSEFRFEEDTVFIGENQLSASHIRLSLDEISLDATFSSVVGLEKYLSNNSAMTYMKAFPLVCYQEVNIMNGAAKGTLNGTAFHAALYMEKTYGHKFPKRWIWIQCNQFDVPINLSFSVGYIPLFGRYKEGFFAVVQHNGTEYRFGTFNFSKIQIEKKDENTVLITLRKRKYKLILEVENNNPVVLVGPSVKAEMILDVLESISATVHLTLIHNNKTLIASKGVNAGFENMY